MLNQAYFYNRDLSIDILRVQRKNRSYEFKTKQGVFTFKFKPRIIQKEIDITFITQAKYKLSDEANIYRSFIYTGKLIYPNALAKQLKVKTLKAKLIIQGIGNACVQKEDFKKWLLKPDKSIESHLHAELEKLTS